MSDKNKDLNLKENAILTNFSRDYAEYININTYNERTDFDDNIESLMTKMDEYTGLVDMIRSDTNLSFGTMLPDMYSKGQQLDALFEKIDKLEAFVTHVKKNMAEVEILLDQAESELSAKNPVTKFFTALPRPSFMGPKSPTSPAKYINPTVFKTEDFLSPPNVEASNTVVGEEVSESGSTTAIETKEVQEDSTTPKTEDI